jgi:hypothetical protein
MKLLIFANALFLVVGCGPQNLGSGAVMLNNGVPTPLVVPPQSVSTPLVVQPQSANIQAFASQPFIVSGGIPPYTFLLTSGGGQVGFNSGLYSAPGAATTATISVSDARGSSTTITILVAGGGTASTGSTTTATNCSTILSYPSVAYFDSSYSDPNYANSPSKGLVYATTSNIADPNSCATWCGSRGSGYCEWSPGSGTEPLCISWPQGTSLTQYSTPWATYAGACQ